MCVELDIYFFKLLILVMQHIIFNIRAPSIATLSGSIIRFKSVKGHYPYCYHRGHLAVSNAMIFRS